MIDIEVLATGSKGNCYLLKSGETRILLDCGLAYRKTLQLLKFELPSAVLVTHEHKDHAKSAADFIKHGVDVYMTTGTAMALGLEENHRLNLIDDKEFSPDSRFEFWAFKVSHDAAEPVNFLISTKDDKILYLTDLGKVPKFNCLDATKILIETNFDHETLRRNKKLDFHQAIRIKDNHLAIDSAVEFLQKSDKSALKEVYLIHISDRHGDGEAFKNIIQEVVGDNVKVIVAKNKVAD